jgi:protein translocase SecG subunit
MEVTVQIAQIIIAVVIIFLVSIQGKGSGLSQSIGGGALYSTRRGAEKIVFYATIISGILFAGFSLATFLV